MTRDTRFSCSKQTQSFPNSTLQRAKPAQSQCWVTTIKHSRYQFTQLQTQVSESAQMVKQYFYSSSTHTQPNVAFSTKIHKKDKHSLYSTRILQTKDYVEMQKLLLKDRIFIGIEENPLLSYMKLIVVKWLPKRLTIKLTAGIKRSLEKFYQIYTILKFSVLLHHI